MMISTKGRYALRFLADVAEPQGDGFVPLKDVAARQEISENYLEIVVNELVKGGLLIAARRKGGGYRLNRPPEVYHVKDSAPHVSIATVPVFRFFQFSLDFPPRGRCKVVQTGDRKF